MNATEEKDTLVRKLADDYGKYFEVNTTQQKQQLDFELETVLTQLEKYKAFLKEVQNENCVLLEEIPKIFDHYQGLKKTFQNIDNLENLVCEIKTDLNNLESAVAKAERDLKVGPSISAVFRPFLFMKESPVLDSISENSGFAIPELKFEVKNYFSSNDEKR